MNRAPCTGPRLVAERKETAEAADTIETAETAASASKKRRVRQNRITEASEEAEDAEDTAAQQLIAEQVAADRSVDAGVINDGDEDTSDLVL